MIHLTPQQLSSYMDGELNEASTELVRRHMGACEECTLKFAQLEIQEDLLSKALVHDPGDAFFEQFLEAVGKQIPASKGSPKSSPARLPSKAAPKTPLPNRLAMSRPAPAAAPPTPAPATPEPPHVEDAPAEAVRGEAIGFSSEREEDNELVGAADTMDDEARRPVDAMRDVEMPRREPAPVDEPVPSAESARDVDTSGNVDAETGATEVRATAPRARSYDRPAPRPKAPPRLQPKPARPRVHRPAPSIPWYAALLLAVISASAGVMVSRTQPVSSWLDSVAPRAGQAPAPVTPSVETPSQETPQAPTEEIIPAPSKPATTSKPAPKPAETPARTTETPAKGPDAKPNDDSPAVDDEAMDPELTSTDDEVSSGPDLPDIQPQEATRFLGSDAAGRNSKDPYASVPASALSVVRAAQKSVAAADTDPSAARYETAASDWERAIPLLKGWQQSLGRFELASARYRAWEMAPTAARATAATAAIRSYMTTASQGPARDQARAWMARLAH